jgi:hypothetical protein
MRHGGSEGDDPKEPTNVFITGVFITGSNNLIQAGQVSGTVHFAGRDVKHDSADEDGLDIRRQAFLFNVYEQALR